MANDAIQPYTKAPKWLTAAIKRREVGDLAGRALLSLADYTVGFNQPIRPMTARQIAEDIGSHPNHVRPALRQLVAQGYVIETADGIGLGDEGTIEAAKQRQTLQATPNVATPNVAKSNAKRCFKATPNVASTGPDAAGGADSAEPKKNSKENCKENLPPKGGFQEGGQAIASKVSGLVAMAQEAEWFEGEQERFFELTPYRRIRDFGMAQGTTAELIKAYLSFSKESRQALWLYADQRKAATATSKPESFTLAWAVKYLQDPASYPAISRKDSFLAAVDLKTAEPAPGNPWRDRPYWRFYDPRFVDVVREDEDAQVAYLYGEISKAFGFEVWSRLKNTHLAHGVNGVMPHIARFWGKRPEDLKTQEAANG